MPVTANKLKKATTHLLLCNLRAVQNNVRHCPLDMREGYEMTERELRPLYEAELRRRGMAVPSIDDKVTYDALVAAALALCGKRGVDPRGPVKI